MIYFEVVKTIMNAIFLVEVMNDIFLRYNKYLYSILNNKNRIFI